MSRGTSASGLMAVTALSLLGCARQEPPRGGPEDRIPPVVIETVPDTFAVVEAGLRKISFRFSERISNRPAGGSMDDAVLVSPSTGNVRVSPGRDGIEVSLGQGLLPDQVYRITVLPVISDMFSNRLRGPFDLIVTTGGAPVPNVIAGAVEDRVTGQPVEGARVEARFSSELGASGDSVVHWNFTDVDGIFSLRYAPTGAYRLQAFEDRNRNGELDPNEPRAQVPPDQLDAPVDTTFSIMSLIEPDTTSAVLLSVEVLDSMAVRFVFDDFVDPFMELAGSGAVVVDSASGESIQVELLHEGDFLTRRAAADPAALDSAAADPSVPSVEALPPGARGGAARVGLSGLVLPTQNVHGVLDRPLVPNAPYSATLSGILNVAGTGDGGGERRFRWEPPVPDSLPADSIPALEAVDRDTLPALETGVEVDTVVAPNTPVTPDTLPRADTLPRPDTVVTRHIQGPGRG